MQVLLNGLLHGILLGTIGVAFATVYRTAKVFHVALGGLCALAPYLVLSLTRSGLPTSVSYSLAVGLVVALGVAIDGIVHWPLEKARASSQAHLIASLGLYLVIVQCISVAWGGTTQVLRTFAGTLYIPMAQVTIAPAQVIGPVSAMLGIVAFVTWLRLSRHGLEFRAFADNPSMASVLGRDIRAIRRRVFGVSAGLGAVAAVGQAWDLGFTPYIGLQAVLSGMVAMIIGGNGSLWGPFLGGLLLGVLRAWIAWAGGSRWEEALIFLLLTAFLLFRPAGIVVKRWRLEESGPR